MAKAVLTYVDEDNNNITLESGSLLFIDQNTKVYKNIETLTNSYSLKTKGIRGKIKLFYISSNSKKEELPIFINDDKPLYISDNYFEDEISEIEKSRKLLFNSKNKLFLRLALRYKLTKDTFDYSVPLSKKQYEYALKKNLQVRFDGYGYFISAKELFHFTICNNKVQILRDAFENALELWKNSINNMSLEELYYFSRNLRILINNYNYRVKTNISIKNFEPRYKNLKLLNATDERIKVMRKTREY